MAVVEFEQVLQFAIDKGASDIHLTPGLPVSFRVQGNIEYIGEPLDPDYSQNLMLSILSAKQQAYLDENRDVDFLVSRRSKFVLRRSS